MYVCENNDINRKLASTYNYQNGEKIQALFALCLEKARNDVKMVFEGFYPNSHTKRSQSYHHISDLKYVIFYD